MSDVFYAFSAGRSGTTSLATYLSYAKNARIFHEPSGGMSPFLKGYVENQKLGHPFTQKELFEGFRKDAIDSVLATGKTYGELSPMLSYLAEGMIDNYPDAKVIWCLRDPKKWIRSAMHVNFRNGVFEDTCAMWYDLMVHISNGYWKAKEENRCIIKMDRMTPEERFNLYKWLDLEPTHDGAWEWMNRTFNEHQYPGPIWAPHPDDWSRSDQEAYDHYVTPLLQEVLEAYPGEQRWTVHE